MLWFHHWVCGSQVSTKREWSSSAQGNNKTHTNNS